MQKSTLAKFFMAYEGPIAGGSVAAFGPRVGSKRHWHQYERQARLAGCVAGRGGARAPPGLALDGALLFFGPTALGPAATALLPTLGANRRPRPPMARACVCLARRGLLTGGAPLSSRPAGANWRGHRGSHRAPHHHRIGWAGPPGPAHALLTRHASRVTAPAHRGHKAQHCHAHLSTTGCKTPPGVH